MLAMDLATASAKLAAATTAYDNALGAQSEGIGDLTVAHQRIDALRAEMTYWQHVVDTLTQKAQVGADSGVSVGVLTPRFRA